MIEKRTALRHAMLAGLIITFAFLLTMTVKTTALADPSGWQRLPGHVPPASRSAERVGEISEQQPMSLTLVLSLRNTSALDTLLQKLYDPEDPQYGHFLTPDQFSEQFAPTEQDYQAVEAFAQANGLTVTGTHSNRLVLDVAGPAGAVEQTFGLRMEHFRDSHGRDFFGPSDDPAIPASLASRVSAVVGLDNATVWHPDYQQLDPAITADASPNQVGTGPYGALSPSDIKKAYNLASTNLNGAGQTLAVFELDGYSPSDITGYASQFGLTKTPLQNVLVDGVSGSASGGGAAEVTLDIELQMALAPAASKIMVYEGPNSGQGIIDTYNRIATDDVAKEISTSWGAAEQTGASSLWNSENAIFKQMAAQGQSIYASSGDSGAYDNGSSLSVDDPASQPYVVGVGGTHLTLGAGGVYSKESTWNGGSVNAGAGGGGISKIWGIPTWQQGAVSPASGGSQTMRNVPDVSLDADPNTGYAIYLNGGWSIYGGTSCASPLWAAFTALVNQQRLASSASYLGFADPTLYQVGKGARYSSDFHDIADGSTNLYYPAVTGYDEATGWGSFNGAGLLADLAPAAASLAAPTGLTAKASTGQVVLTWTAVSGAASYNLYRATASGQETLYKSGLTAASYTDTSVTNGTTYYYEVTAVGAGGESARSNEATATPAATGPTASAAFVKQDTSTSGNWKGVYGADGFDVITDPSANDPSLPAYASLTPSGNSTYQWAAPGSTTAKYALQEASAGSTGRLAGVWYSTSSFSLDLNLTDGNTHQVALYVLDWLSAGRGETITMTNAATGAVLNSRAVANFGGGDYEVYNISGHVKISFTVTSGKNCVVSGIFFR